MGPTVLDPPVDGDVDQDIEDLEKLTVDQLLDRLDELRLNAFGNKAELVERLRDYAVALRFAERAIKPPAEPPAAPPSLPAVAWLPASLTPPAAGMATAFAHAWAPAAAGGGAPQPLPARSSPSALGSAAAARPGVQHRAPPASGWQRPAAAAVGLVAGAALAASSAARRRRALGRQTGSWNKIRRRGVTTESLEYSADYDISKYSEADTTYGIIGVLTVLMFAVLFAIPWFTYFKDEEEIEEDELRAAAVAEGPGLFDDGPGLFDDESVQEKVKVGGKAR